MKRSFMVLFAVLVAVAIAMPAMAAVEFKYGGQFRVRWITSQNAGQFQDFVDDMANQNNLSLAAAIGNPGAGIPANAALIANNPGFDVKRRSFMRDTEHHHYNFIDQRLRLYFTFIASENLKLVTKFEMGDAVWGDTLPAVNYGRVGADGINVEVKNIYLDFMIPQTPIQALVGVQSVSLLNSWVFEDDVAAAILRAKFGPITVGGGYAAGQNESFQFNDRNQGGANQRSGLTFTDENVDDLFLTVDYAGGPLTASFVFFYQYGHNTGVSFDPYTWNTPFPGIANAAFNTTAGLAGIAGPIIGTNSFTEFSDNNLFDIGFNVAYKMDWMMAYLNFVKNFGSIDVWREFSEAGVPVNRFDTIDYEGWMIDVGTNFYFGPFTVKLGGFYTSGQELNQVQTVGGATQVNGINTDAGFKANDRDYNVFEDDIQYFVSPLGVAANFQSEIIGGGITENRGYSKDLEDNLWSGWPNYSNVWTITLGTSWQVLPTTKLGFSYWYWATSEDVVSGSRVNGLGLVVEEYDNEIGHELNFSITQGIVDGLTLDIVAAYLFSGDALTNNQLDVSRAVLGSTFVEDDDVYEIAARLQWNF